MIEVGLLYKGTSAVTPHPEIKLTRCITFKQLQKFKYIVLENVKKECLDDIKKLPKDASVYSLGACDSQVKQITFYISDISEILDEKDAVKKEKEASIRAIKEQTEKNQELEKQLNDTSSNIGELQDRIRDLSIERDKYKYSSEQNEKQIKALQDKLQAEIELRKQAESKYKSSFNELSSTLETNENEKKELERNLTSGFQMQVDAVKKKLEEKEEIIQQKDKDIEELKRVNEELGKVGTIPDISYKYTGQAQIIGVCGEGSYGVSELANYLARYFSKQKKTLLIDLDFKGGNINKYVQSENKTIENVLKGGPLLKEHVFSSKASGTLDFVGGVNLDWTPYDILQLPWDQIFEGDYEYIIVDCGIYGGYNIQTTIGNFIKRLGKLIYLYVEEKHPGVLTDDILKIKNYAEDMTGIPYISNLYFYKETFFTNAMANQMIKEQVINKLVNANGEVL